MPTYEYKCLDCGKTFDVFQNMTAPRLTECRFCGGRVKRLIGAGAGIIFKGSGFYCTDYKNNGGDKDSSPKADPSNKTDTSEVKSGDGDAVKAEAKTPKAPKPEPVSTPAGSQA